MNVSVSHEFLPNRPSTLSCIFAAFCCITFTVVGCVGNWLTIIALTRCRRLRNATTAFVVSLAVADFLFCAVCLPLTATRYIYEEWILGNELCNLFPFFFYGNVAASLMSMTAITFNRSLNVMFHLSDLTSKDFINFVYYAALLGNAILMFIPKFYKQSCHRFVLINCYPLYSSVYSKLNVGLMITFCWSFSYIILVPTLAGQWGHFGYDEASFSCTILRGEDGRSPKKFLFVLAFLMPTATIIVCYSCIFYKVRASAVKVLSHEDASSKRVSRVLPRKRDDIRVTCTMLTCFCTFQICFLPLMVVNVFEEDIGYPILHILASVLAWMSACANPFIYVMLNKHYREAYFQLLCSWHVLKSKRNASTEGASGNSRASHLRTVCGEQSRDSQLSSSRDVYV